GPPSTDELPGAARSTQVHPPGDNRGVDQTANRHVHRRGGDGFTARKYRARAKRATQSSRRLRSEPARARAVPVETDSPLLFRQFADLTGGLGSPRPDEKSG